MRIESNLCMNCMKENEKGGVCVNCGYNDTGVYLASYLAPRTLLNGRYIVGRLESYNGEGAVYVGFDTINTVKVIIKEYMPDALCSRQKDVEAITVNPSKLPLYKTYLSEFIELHTTLKNASGLSNIQKVLDVFTANNTAYVICEYVTGISLKSYLANCGGKLSWEQAKALFPPILTTLNQVQRLGIIHRGISPQNIIINDRSELKLIGFGISAIRTVDSEVDYEIFSGFAAPEQYTSLERNGTWTDVYGISALFYRVLTGRIPLSAEDRMKSDKLVEPMMIDRSIPINVSDIIMKGLKLQQEERIHDMAEFIDRLFEQPVRITAPVRNVSVKQQAKPVEKKPSPEKKTEDKKKDNQKLTITLIVVIAVLAVFAFAIFLPIMLGKNDAQSGNNTSTETSDTSLTTTTTTPETSDEESSTTTTILENVYLVPDYVDRSYEKIIESNYFTIVPEYEFNDDYPNGFVFEQDIEAGKEVAEGTTINVKVSKGSSSVALPDYKGKTLDEYKEILNAAQIKYKTKTKSSEDVKSGYVISCSKDVGEKVNVADGETITVYYVK